MKVSACLRCVLDEVPKIIGTDSSEAKALADVLSPKTFKALSFGPINFIFDLFSAETNFGFSLKNP